MLTGYTSRVGAGWKGKGEYVQEAETKGLGGSSLRQKGGEGRRGRNTATQRARSTDEDGDGDMKTKLLHYEDSAPCACCRLGAQGRAEPLRCTRRTTRHTISHNASPHEGDALVPSATLPPPLRPDPTVALCSRRLLHRYIGAGWMSKTRPDKHKEMFPFK
jgi:hypothetical protein